LSWSSGTRIAVCDRDNDIESTYASIIYENIEFTLCTGLQWLILRTLRLDRSALANGGASINGAATGNEETSSAVTMRPSFQTIHENEYEWKTKNTDL
jgi:predicted ATPase